MDNFNIELLNNFIKFYKKEFNDIELFDGIKNDYDVNHQMEFLNIEIEKYKMSNDESKILSNDSTKKYSVYLGDSFICASDLLFVVLIEVSNLEREDSKNQYIIKRKTSDKKVKFQ
ncbi:hypothetical protein BMW23_0453 [Bodo saltans virus]|uniref:Uncharacterized protein n=1 Tax=Bodo saltans virus TaxID=2024608 RepID=A0A2H4UUK6_9VIRU|nr:hypothetical protein QJ851_gp0442 [Bodo saltans virus]ATZ80505.1 hypothetical protein BMW23_0453 [Bodo saltans virus]